MTCDIRYFQRSAIGILIGIVLICFATLACSRRAASDITATPAASESMAISDNTVDWPRWRGERMDGISPEGGWSTDWPEEGPPVLWKTQVGIGFSSMSISDGRLYTMGHQKPAKGDEPEGDRDQDGDKKVTKLGTDTVYCLDIESGDVVWTHSYPCKLVDNLHEGGPAATPTVFDGRVYTVSKEGHFFCLDASTGKVLWQRMFREDLGVKMPGWGFSCSPLIEGDLVIVDGGRTAAYNRLTGDVVWKTEKFRPGYGSAVSFDLTHGDEEPQRLIAMLNNDVLILLKAETGEEFSRREWTTAYQTSASTPIVVGDQVFISTGYRRGCLLAKMTKGELEDIYENKDMCNHMNNCVLWDGCWYGFNGNSHNRRNVTLVCLDFQSGEVHWKKRGLGCGSLMIAGGKLICLSDRGELVIAEPTAEEFREIARAKVLEGRCWTVPVLSGGRIFARNAVGDLVCVDVRQKQSF